MSTHTIKVKSKEIDINKIKFLSPEELDKIKTDKRIIAGCQKNLHEVIILSEDYNNSRNVPTIDLRTFTQDRNTGKYIPLPQGFRLDPAAFSILMSMLKDNEDLIHTGVFPAGTIAEGATDQSYHLEEQVFETIDNS